MSPRTPTLPPSEPAMWRKLLAKVHPDAGGDHELFIWTMNLREHVAGDIPEPPRYQPPRRATNTNTDRVPFVAEDFGTLTRRALDFDAPEMYSRLLRLLDDCEEAHHGQLLREQERGLLFDPDGSGDGEPDEGQGAQ